MQNPFKPQTGKSEIICQFVGLKEGLTYYKLNPLEDLLRPI